MKTYRILTLLTVLFCANTLRAAEWQVIGGNDLGMHCMDGTDFSVFSILPPYNTIHVQVVHNGQLVTSGSGLDVTYEAIADPEGSINTSSADKINFWEYAEDMYGAQPAGDMGLAGYAMPGTSNIPRHMEYDATNHWFTGEGIPLSPFDDSGRVNYYPMMKVVVRSGGVEVASTRIVLPVSDEMTCSACHQSGSANDARLLAGWRWHPDDDKDVKLNILRLHDEKQVSNPAYLQALLSQGYNTNGLYQTVVADGSAILCARCHRSNALPVPPDPNVTTTMTQAMHAHHGTVTDPATGLSMDSALNRDSCYRCHPGSSTRCLRGAMGASVAADGGLAIECQSCHGTMSMVGSASRQGWFDEPKCQSCHPGVNGSDPIRYVTVFETNGTERIPANTQFAHPNDTLYRFSTGHGNLQCSACHGSPHAIFPSAHANDNIQNIEMQGHKGTVVECMNCHTAQPQTFNGGPHGMHPVGDTAFSRKADGRSETLFHGQIHDNGMGTTQCKACHGEDYRGTVLSRTQADRTIGSRSFWKGYQIGCYTCHNGPSSERTNADPAPVVANASTTTTANTPVSIPLITNEGELRIVSQAQNGTVGLSGTNATYYPFFNFVGSDSFTFAAWDGKKDSNLGTVTVAVSEGTCVLVCESLVPSNAASHVDVPFWANATLSNCSGQVTWLWSFGDGGSDTNGFSRHTFAQGGRYAWNVVASSGALSITNAGTITIGDFLLDSDGDGIEDDWEWAVFQSLDVADSTSDFDQDGLSDRAEFLCGTGVKDPESKLDITETAPRVVHWASEPNRVYSISATTSLVEEAFAPLVTDLAATPPENTYTDLTTEAEARFYRVELQ